MGRAGPSPFACHERITHPGGDQPPSLRTRRGGWTRCRAGSTDRQGNVMTRIRTTMAAIAGSTLAVGLAGPAHGAAAPDACEGQGEDCSIVSRADVDGDGQRDSVGMWSSEAGDDGSFVATIRVQTAAGETLETTTDIRIPPHRALVGRGQDRRRSGPRARPAVRAGRAHRVVPRHHLPRRPTDDAQRPERRAAVGHRQRRHLRERVSAHHHVLR